MGNNSLDHSVSKHGHAAFRAAVETPTHVYRWDRQGRKGQSCRILARGKMNSICVMFSDGYTMGYERQCDPPFSPTARALTISGNPTMFHKVSDDEGYTGFFIEWIEEWSQFFQFCNWYTFRPIAIEFEDERNMGGLECTFIILGLGFRARWNYRRTEQVESILEQVEAIKAGDIRERE